MMLRCKTHLGKERMNLILMFDPKREGVLVIGGFLKLFILKERDLRTIRILKNKKRRPGVLSRNLPANEILGSVPLGIYLPRELFLASCRHHLNNRPMARVL